MNNEQLVTLFEVDYIINGKRILDEVSTSIYSESVVGVVGKNGSGKTTLLNIIMSNLEIDSGRIDFKKDIKIVCLSQDSYKNNHGDDMTVAVYLGEQFSQFSSYFDLNKIKNKKLSELSSGQLRKVILASKLSIDADLLILDEPTNHLDLEAIMGMQRLIKELECTVLLVSHDRYFLDSVCTDIIEIYDRKIYEHPGNYSEYLERRERRFAQLESADSKRNQILKHEKEWYNAGVKARETKNKSRAKRYLEMAAIDEFRRDKHLPTMIQQSPRLGNQILNLKRLSVSRGGQELVDDLDLKIEEDMKIGIIGPNGAGKSTLLKTLVGEYDDYSGKIRPGLNTHFNYFDQDKSRLDVKMSVMESIGDGEELVYFNGRQIDVRSYLIRFLLFKPYWDRDIGSLSGGEKTRLLLARYFLTKSNFLILDEPTNDLDVDTLEALERSLNSFEGCMMLVSHDRYFLDKVCNHILYLDGQGSYIFSAGNYSRFVDKYFEGDETSVVEANIDLIENIKREKKTKPKKPKVNKGVSKKIKTLEQEIEVLEKEIKDFEFKFNEPRFLDRNRLELNDLYAKLESMRNKLESKQDEYLKLSIDNNV